MKTSHISHKTIPEVNKKGEDIREGIFLLINSFYFLKAHSFVKFSDIFLDQYLIQSTFKAS